MYSRNRDRLSDAMNTVLISDLVYLYQLKWECEGQI